MFLRNEEGEATDGWDGSRIHLSRSVSVLPGRSLTFPLPHCLCFCPLYLLSAPPFVRCHIFSIEESSRFSINQPSSLSFTSTPPLFFPLSWYLTQWRLTFLSSLRFHPFRPPSAPAGLLCQEETFDFQLQLSSNPSLQN